MKKTSKKVEKNEKSKKFEKKKKQVNKMKKIGKNLKVWIFFQNFFFDFFFEKLEFFFQILVWIFSGQKKISVTRKLK